MTLLDYVEINPPTLLPKGRPVPFVSMSAIEPGRKKVYADDRREGNGSGSKFEPRDVLFARITPCLENGKIAQYIDAEPGRGSTEFFVLRARPNVADQDFVFYFALQPRLRAAAEKSMTGASGRQRANVRALTEFECTFPPLRIQRGIASILTAYDDLIENNRRRFRLLEDMARTLHHEWFVNFAFPRHHPAQWTASLLGRIPAGWKVKRFTDRVYVNPRIVVPREGEKPFVPMGSLANDSMLITDVELRSGNSGSKFQNGDTLFARITPCLANGKTGFVQFLPDLNAVAFGSTEFIVLRSRTVTPEFVYLLARTEEFRHNAIKSMSGASGRQRVRETCFDRFMVVLPPRELLERFSLVVRPIFKQIQVLHLEAGNLRRTRDLLLPRLMSGQITLGEAVA